MKSRAFVFAFAWSCTLVLLIESRTQVHAQQTYPFMDPNLGVEQRIDNILSLMTLDEKVGALGTNPSVPRLGIKGSSHVEGLHGLAQGGPAKWGGRTTTVTTTQFPQSVGLGETWDPDLLREAAAVEADEARYIFQSPQYKSRSGIVVRAPNSDLARDPRWGRTEESYGEDPYLTGTLAVAFVKGLQGPNPKYWETAALLKHFMANSNENGRGGSSSDFDQRLLREYYSVPFRMGIEEGGARAFMTSYNAVNHVPMTASPVLKQMVMKEWGFDGIICTDAGALTNMVTQHHYYPDIDQAVAGAIHAGINQFLDRYKDGVNSALKKGLITEKDIDQNLRGVYRVMIHLGLLDPPAQVPYESIMAKEGQPEPWNTDAHRDVARRITEKSIVLLKNTDHLLPLDKSAIHSVAVIGPRADEVFLDWYSGTPPNPVTPLAGIKKLLGDGVTVNYALNNDDGKAVAAARGSDVAIVFVGNHPTCNAGWEKCPDPGEGKEAVDRKSLTLDPLEQKVMEDVLAANPKTIGVLISSFPYAVTWMKQSLPAILHMAHDSEEEGTAIAEALFGVVNPGGRLVATWPSSMDQLPPMMDYNLRDGRTYMYFKGEPLFPFGFGLSYSTFQYSNLKVSSGKMRPDGTITVSVDVRNTSNRAGDEVVQMYVKHLDSKVSRPNEELKGFRRITLAGGEMTKVELPLRAHDLAYWDETRNAWTVEADRVRVAVGSSSADLKADKTIQVAR
jgi:beta-glucosidase